MARARRPFAVKRSSERPSWWATSAVPYRYFWLLPAAGAVIGLAAASYLGVPVWLGFVCGEIPALALEARWRHRTPPWDDAPHSTSVGWFSWRRLVRQSALQRESEMGNCRGDVDQTKEVSKPVGPVD